MLRSYKLLRIHSNIDRWQERAYIKGENRLAGLGFGSVLRGHQCFLSRAARHSCMRERTFVGVALQGEVVCPICRLNNGFPPAVDHILLYLLLLPHQPTGLPSGPYNCCVLHAKPNRQLSLLISRRTSLKVSSKI